MFKKNKYFTHTKKKNLILQDPKIIAETIIKFISNKDKNVIFLPDKYKFITYFLYFWKFLKYVK
jgi:hypothetical protein